MSSIYDDTSCRCVQGIEVFLDPRNYTPSYGVFEVIDDDPIDFQSFYAMNKRNLAQQTAAEAKEDVSITTKQVLNLVVQGTDLINKGYMRLKPFQLNSCFVEIETLDIKWLEADAVSIIFTHSKLEESLIIPIVFKENTHKAKVLIPNDVLIPGELTISLCTMDSYGAVNSLVTNGIDYTIYSSDIKPVDFGSTAKFDVYYSLVSTLNTLIADLNSKDAKLIELEARVKALEEA